MPKTTTIAILIFLLAIIILPRTLDLNAFQTADEKRWLANTVGFITNLAHGDIGHLMQQPHPGVTTQWLGSPTVFSDNWATRKLPLVLSQSALVCLIGYILWRLAGKRTALFATLLLAINPALIAHTRIYAMDSLLSLFLILSILLLFLWHKTHASRYLVLSGFTSAAAILSKLPGIIIIPLSLFIIFYWHRQKTDPKHQLKLCYLLTLWLTSLIISAILILPSIAINPTLVSQDIISWLQSDDYSLHQIGPTYYLGTLAFISTPLHWLALTITFLLLFTKKLSPLKRDLVIFLLIFVLLFTIQMSIGSKKGDRYILPVFLALDIITAIFLSWLASQNYKRLAVIIAASSVIGLILLQTTHLMSLHPHYLAYINPITQFNLGERRLGWGEGLDLAADYLNQLPNASSLTVASYYPNEFQANFVGQAVPAHQHDNPSVDYIVIYRAMFDRGLEAWETDVVDHYRPLSPQHTIFISGTPMAWIFSQ